MEAIEAAGFSGRVISSTESSADQALVLQIGGMTCSSCSSAVEQALRAQPGVASCSVNLLANKAEVGFWSAGVPACCRRSAMSFYV